MPVKGDRSPSWLVLIHQVPPKPDYLRVKVGRQLLRAGAIAVKNSVYVLPDEERLLEDLQWILAEIRASGGTGSICRAEFVDGLTAEELRHRFGAARDAEYAEISDAARVLVESARKRSRARRGPPPGVDDLARLRRRFDTVAGIDFFGASKRAAAEDALHLLESLIAPAGEVAAPVRPVLERASYSGRTWVTRPNVFVDRIASAWLIRRFIDAQARFRFTDSAAVRAAPREVRFDMFDGEFTHEGNRCTFEVLLERFGLDDPALVPIAELVHQIDLRDDRFDRPDAPGLERVLTAMCAGSANDGVRLERGAQLLDDLYQLFASHGRRA